ncbi:MAG: UDP-N-acetylmuramoyl-tripeptide--D-alanyl-D-alanine ligase [Chloroflexi bacterium]|nr:MAG: UDP-N-acetylmuramoyl-tripeptide--D-alanyl-D-alanine ligase [Chloroflexota bacterium]
MFNSLQDKFRNYVQKKMEGYVVSYFNAHSEIRLVVIAGSVGKTSTKSSVATMLSQRYRVRMHDGNHNTHMSAPLAILGIPYPENIKSYSQWRAVFRAAEAKILGPTDVDIIVQEIGADHPGEIAHFGTYLHPHIAVITAITPEHMEFFKSMEAVAQEELSAANFSQLAIINKDDIDGQYAAYLTNANVHTYGTSDDAEYHFRETGFSLDTGHVGELYAPEIQGPITATIDVLGRHNLRPAVAAAVVGIKMGLTPQEIATGLSKVVAISGRMNLIQGANNSTVIDDTYNSSPVAAESAVQTFYTLESPQRIAIMGSMNELGESSAAEHEKIGRMFRPELVEWVVTVGDEAEKYLAPAARSQGCQVKSFKSSIQAGAFVHSIVQPGALILA